MANLKNFINHCITDEEFWMRGGIPSKEKYYINKLGMTEEQVNSFYDAMVTLQHLAKELKEE